MKARILIIEDDIRLSELLQRNLRESDYDTQVANDGETGKLLALNENFDLVISDIMLPKLNGIEVCKAIRQRKPHIPILMLTALGSTDEKIEGFDAGADDYLVKPFETRELEARIKALLKRARKLSEGKTENILQYEDLYLDMQTKLVKRGNTEISLTPKEFNLLSFLLKHKEKVVSRDEIARKVWDMHFDTGTNFIDVYINYLRNKVDKPFEHKLIHTKPGMGFILKKLAD